MRCCLSLNSNEIPDLKKIHNFIGLARRAGKASVGSGVTESVVRARKAIVVILAEDCSQGTAKRLTDKCKSYDVPILICGTKGSLGQITGSGETAAVAITDMSFAGEIMRLAKVNGEGNLRGCSI